jgi:hypothetical protein
MLDDITLYWFTNTATSSARLYRENANKFGLNHGIVDFPVGISIFPREIFRVPRSWADKVYSNIYSLERARQARPFRSPGAACDIRTRAPRLFPRGARQQQHCGGNAGFLTPRRDVPGLRIQLRPDVENSDDLRHEVSAGQMRR